MTTGDTETPEGDQAVSEPAASARKPGVDQVLQFLDTENPVMAEVVRDFQRNNSLLDTERSEVDRMRQELRDGLEDLERMRTTVDAEQPEEEQDEELSRIPQEQQDLLEKWLRANNYVSQDELTAREQQRMMKGVADDANKRGVSQWGEGFGHYDDEGKFLINPAARDDMAPIFNRLVNQKGLTFEDLYLLKNYERLLGEARETGRREAQNAVNTRERETAERVGRAGVVSRSSTGATEPVLYDPDKESGDIGAVFRRLRGLAAS